MLTASARLIPPEKGTWPFFIYCAATRPNPVMPHALETLHPRDAPVLLLQEKRNKSNCLRNFKASIVGLGGIRIKNGIQNKFQNQYEMLRNSIRMCFKFLTVTVMFFSIEINKL